MEKYKFKFKHDLCLTKNTSVFNKNNYTFIDLFCGIGGFHMALSQLNGKCVFASEIDSKCRYIYSKNHNIIPEGDITKVLNKVPDHDILCGGFPCQAFSNAGKKLAFDDERGLLFDNIVQILKNKNPSLAILENVKHIKKVSNGEVYKYIYDQINKIGYSLFDVEISPDQLGIPQNRERVVFIAIRNDLLKNETIKSFEQRFNARLKDKKTQYLIKNLKIDIYDNVPHTKYNISEELLNVLTAWDEFIKIFSVVGDFISPVVIDYFTEDISNENKDYKNDYIKKIRYFIKNINI